MTPAMRPITQIKTIRPWRIFNQVEAQGAERVAHVRIPQRRDPANNDRSLRLLETFLLIALLKLTKAERVFEFGTYLGSNALNLALNSDAEVYTLDLDLKSAGNVTGRPEDLECTAERLKAGRRMEWEAFPGLKICPILGDSTRMDLSAFFGKVDLVWLDGGRDERTICADAENALKMLRPDKLAVIGWHDYQAIPELTHFLDVASLVSELYHIEDTSTVLKFNRSMNL